MENYYSILEVPETSTIEDIKKSYRKLSLKWHPDRNRGNSEAEETFKKINAAYETLGNSESKTSYDMGRKNPFAGLGGGGGGVGINLDELFANLFFRGGEGMSMAPGLEGLGRFPPGANIHVFRNGVDLSNAFQMRQKPAPVQITLNVNMEMVLSGGTVPVEIERWIIENGNKVSEMQKVYVDIPKGIDNDEIIILEGKGNISGPDNKGDVKVFIKIENDTEFRRTGLDLIYNKTISLKDSLCGFSFEMKYINNVIYTINNKPGNVIPNDYHKIIPNMGLTRDSHTGNLIIVFKVEFPQSISLENIETIKSIL